MSTLGPISIFMVALPLFYISTWRQSKWPRFLQLAESASSPCSEAECQAAQHGCHWAGGRHLEEGENDVQAKDPEYHPGLLYMVCMAVQWISLCCHWRLFCFSWSVNVVDGILLIVAHATNIPTQGHSNFYRHLYGSKYIYGVWMLEVLAQGVA